MPCSESTGSGLSENSLFYVVTKSAVVLAQGGKCTHHDPFSIEVLVGLFRRGGHFCVWVW